MRLLCMLMLVLTPSVAGAVIYVADNTLTVDCSSPTYNPTTRDCTGNYSKAYNTIAEAIAQTVPGDTVYIRQGTWTERIDLQGPQKQGSSGNYLTISGYPGDARPVIQCADPTIGGYGCVKHRTALGWFIIQDLVVDGAGMAFNTGWWIANGNHDIIIRRVEIRNQQFNGFYVEGSNNILFDDLYIHSAHTPDCATGSRWHGLYLHHSTNVTVKNTTITDMPGIGVQIFPGPLSGITVDSNDIHHNTKCDTVNNGAVVIYPSVTGGPIDNVKLINNLIHHNGLTAGGQYLGGGGGGVRVLATSATLYATNVQIHNNTIIANEYLPTCREGGCTGYGIYLGDNNNGAVSIKNNLVTENEQGAIFLGTGNAVLSSQACKSGEFCGTTGKVIIAASTDCIVSSATPDYTLRSAAVNNCRNTGTAVATRPNPVLGVPDIGAYELGFVTGAFVSQSIPDVVGDVGYVDIATSVDTLPIIPATGMTGVTLSCVTCTGSPVVVDVRRLEGSQNVIRTRIAGITKNGSCTVSIASTNITDSRFIGGTLGRAQSINAVPGQTVAVSGVCRNTGPLIDSSEANFLW